jgi:hypothetical protein
MIEAASVAYRHRRSGPRPAFADQSRAPGLLEGDRTAGGPARQWLRGGYFPPRAAETTLTLYMGRRRALHREAK